MKECKRCGVVKARTEFYARQKGGSTVVAACKSCRYPDGFQVACWNCNAGRDLNGGVCPHQEVQPSS